MKREVATPTLSQQSGSEPSTPEINDPAYLIYFREHMTYISYSVKKSLDALLDVLKKRGTTGILGLARMFRVTKLYIHPPELNIKVADDNNNKKIEFEEFYKVLRDYQLDLPLVQVQKLFALFDKDRSGSVDYDELLLGIRVRK